MSENANRGRGTRSINLGPTALGFVDKGGPGMPQLLEVARAIESLGYAGMWSAENAGSDVFTLLAASAVVTDELALGTHIVPIFGRAPSVVAMHAASLNALSGGRVRLGLGASTKPVVEKWRGEKFEKPMARMREYIEIIRRLLAGEKVTFEGETVQVRDCQLLVSLGDPPPIYMAAIGPKMLELAGQVADGVLIGMVTPQGLPDSVRVVREAAIAAGRDPDAIDITASLSMIVHDDPDEVRAVATRHAAFYLSVENPYQRTLISQGYGEDVAVFKEHWDAGDRKRATESMSQRLLDAVVISGSGDRVNEVLTQMQGPEGDVSLAVLPILTEPTVDARLTQLEQSLSAIAPRAAASGAGPALSGAG